MKRIRSNYHTLHDPKLRRAIIANCNQETLKSICECALNVLLGNIPLSACSKRKLRTYNSSILKVAYNSLSLSAKRKVIGQRGGFLLPLLSAILPTLAGLLFRSRYLCYIKVSGLARGFSEIQAQYKQSPWKNSEDSLMKKRRKLPPQNDYDNWIKMSEEDVTGKAQLKDIAMFMKRALPEKPQPTVPKF